MNALHQNELQNDREQETRLTVAVPAAAATTKIIRGEPNYLQWE